MGRRKKGLSFYEKKKKLSTHTIKEILGMAFATFAAVFLAIFLVYSVGIRTSVIGVSMEPTLSSGQRILINRIFYTISPPERGDIIVFKPEGSQSSHYYVKRVVAVPGETGQIMNGRLYVDGIPEEDQVYDKMEEAGIAENEILLGNNEYFVLGDNRNSSEDSRSANIGPVRRENIYGKAWFHLGNSDTVAGWIE